ncbi:MAG: insulinase family protein [Verrucomicrobia subdivision 3 bacterium]|nr:insulinase family protein [Limisphaerales bacterium]
MKSPFLCFLVLLMTATLTPSSYAETNLTAIPAIPPGVQLTTLDNGLTLILREDHSAPVVSAQAWCKAGSIDEGKWLGAGLSHVLEHMLFKGTTTRAAGRIDQEVQDAGGYMNAYTSFDRTVYWINVPNTGGKVAIEILCDIVQNATLPADEMVKEKQVILREMDMNQDDPGQRSARRLFETAYTRSPYRFTIIGYPDIYNEVQRDDVSAYYREKYAPNNLFFVVVGDIKAKEVEEQIRGAFAKTRARPLPPAVLPEEPKQVAVREIIEEAPIEMGHYHFSWHIPDLRHPDVPLLDILATLLGSGRSSRLFQEVRERQGLVNSVDAWTYSPGNPGLFGMSAVVDPDKFNAARAAMLAEVEKMKTNLITAEELGKAVKQFTTATLASRKTMQGQAQDLGGSWMAANDLNFSARYLEAVKRATPADLQRVAREYLTTENRTLYALLPTGAAPKLTDFKDAFADKPVQKFEFSNGLRLLVKEDHRLPFVEFRAVLRGGVLAETPQNNGVSLLTAKLIVKGTPSRTAEQIATEIESLGGSIESYSGNNSLGVNCEVLSNDFATGLDLVADVLLRPTFPGAALERERQIQLAAIKAQKDELLPTASRMMRRGMFGDIGYGLHTNGTETSVQTIQIEDLKKFHDACVRPNNCVLAVFGDVQPDAVRAAVDKHFGSWPKRPVEFTDKSAHALKEVKRLAESRDKKQAVMVIGFPGTTLHNDDRYALELIQEACSDLGSRVFVRIREKLGLAYYVGAQNFLGMVPGFFAFYVGTEPEKVALVETELLKEAAALRAEGLTDEELKRAKAKVIGQKKIARQDLGTFAMNSALDEIYGLGFAHTDVEDRNYEAVTLAQTKAAAQKYLTPDRMVIAVVKPGGN